MTSNGEQATDRHHRRRWAVAAVTLAVNLGSFALPGARRPIGQPGRLRCPCRAGRDHAAVRGAGQCPAGGRGPRRQPPAPDGRVAPGRGQASAGRGQPLGRRRLRRAAGAVASRRAVPAPAVHHERPALGGVRPARRGSASCPKGVLVGQGRLRLLATGPDAGIVVRIVVGVLLVRHGGGLEGAFVAMVWGEVVTAVIVLVGLRELLATEGPVTARAGARLLRATGSRAGQARRRPRRAGPTGRRLRLPPRWGEARLAAWLLPATGC